MSLPRTIGLPLLVVLCCAPAIAQQGARTEIPLRVYDQDLTVVEGNIEPLPESLNFVIDTGATRTVIDRRIADHFGPILLGGQIRHFTKVFPVKWISIPEIRLGPIHRENLPVVILDLAQFVHAPIRIDAIVGLDLLRLESFTLDYRARKVIFGVPPRLKHATGMGSKQPYLSVKANIGGHTVRLLVDTGATGVALYSACSDLPFDGKSGEQQVTWPSVQGRITAEKRVVPRINLGGVKLGTTVLILDGGPGSQFEIDGYLGTKSLNAKRLAFDFQDDVFGWE